MTTLVRRNNNMFDSLFNDVFDDFFNDRAARSTVYEQCPTRCTQVYNNDEEWQVVFAVPGVKKEAVEIKVDNHVSNCLIREPRLRTTALNFVASFSRSWNIDRMTLKLIRLMAKHEDGVLTITIPKPEAKKRVVRTIQVN